MFLLSFLSCNLYQKIVLYSTFIINKILFKCLFTSSLLIYYLLFAYLVYASTSLVSQISCLLPCSKEKKLKTLSNLLIVFLVAESDKWKALLEVSVNLKDKLLWKSLLISQG